MSIDGTSKAVASNKWWENCSVITRLGVRTKNMTLRQIIEKLDEFQSVLCQ